MPSLVNITIPVYNEEKTLSSSISKLCFFLEKNFPYSFEIIIADNASTDATLSIAQDLEKRFENVKVSHLRRKGRGGALKQVWSESHAEILSYMDCDLSTDLKHFAPLIEAIEKGHWDIAVGSRLLPNSVTTRGLKRELISRSYNLLIKTMFHTRFSDAQCGFKAITKVAFEELCSLIEDEAWFMDTELLILAEKLGYSVFDLPVKWIDDPDTSVRIFQTAVDDLKGLARLKRSFKARRYESHSRGRLAPA
jgi:glycosyltransferase involved in cell wall biosynthesis